MFYASVKRKDSLAVLLCGEGSYILPKASG
jgi:hypothetical protein